MGWHTDCPFCGVSFDMHKRDCPALSGAHRQAYRTEDLVFVAPAYAWEAPPKIGQRVWLASGSPAMLVVDMDGDEAVVGFDGETGPKEIKINWRCLVPHLFSKDQ